ncbi:MAG: hypothetical protein KAI55_02390 [Candidatus Aenigmarchaeota archaeon]|nr:hypothetical protein [Candidatus Aenigmarchaeota archaeon]
MHKKLYFTLIFFLIIIVILIVSGSHNYTSEELTEMKACNVDSDCKSKSGCYADCWNERPCGGYYWGDFCTSFRTGNCPDTGGPDKCVCQEGICTGSYPTEE